MLKIVKQCNRISADIPFYFELPSSPDKTKFSIYYEEKFMKTGKVLKTMREFSDDNLVVSNIVLWKDRKTFREFLCDDICYDFLQISKRYDIENGIRSKVISVEEIDE